MVQGSIPCISNLFGFFFYFPCGATSSFVLVCTSLYIFIRFIQRIHTYTLAYTKYDVLYACTSHTLLPRFSTLAIRKGARRGRERERESQVTCCHGPTSWESPDDRDRAGRRRDDECCATGCHQHQYGASIMIGHDHGNHRARGKVRSHIRRDSLGYYKPPNPPPRHPPPRHPPSRYPAHSRPCAFKIVQVQLNRR